MAPRSGGSQWVQTDPVDFSHSITSADRAYEQISELPALTIPNPGVWQVSYSARTNIGNPASVSGAFLHTALFNNGALIPGSEALTGKTYNPGESSQDTIGQTFLYTFKAGDVVRLYGYRIGQPGFAAVLSNGDGRTGITAHWVSF
ncbi:hypothetical protein FNH05_06940 [Amycolatopsis rhizosphaerae]|uniref:Uncharacterized protein n=1 Tax=Amycolatopsis rhizosphaerae TaxID=2053003 RepID=A0A558D9W3_9PSEU|nr:hypothetical protein [Amycolatopsis rhizosphaerae]TVT57824.1 hypothetical protein FNH05_06940 [Amycolatopsis rhizosphaerae]